MGSKKISLLGGGGFIGGYLAQALLAQGDEVILVSRRWPQVMAPLKAIYGDRVQYRAINVLEDNADLAACFAVDSVVNLVGVLYEQGDQTFQRMHEDWPMRLAHHARSAAVSQCLHLSGLGVDKNAESQYAVTKKKGDAAFLEAFPSGMVLRPSVVFGPGDQFVNRFHQMAAWSPFLPLIGGGLNRMQPIYVHDLVQCILASLSTKDFHGQIIELGGAKVHTFQAIMQQILRWGGRRRLLLPVSYEAAERLGYGVQRVMPSMLTVDQVKLLRHDNCCQPQALTAADLGVTVQDFMAMKADAVLGKRLLKLDRS